MNVQIPVKWLQELRALCGPEDHELRERVMVSITAMDEQAARAVAVPDGWREKFAADVYADLAAADNQDVPLEEYPARILKVLDSIVGPRHPVVIKWRNDAIRNCIAIAYKYCRDPESHKYLKQDLEAMLTTEPAPQAQADARDAEQERWMEIGKAIERACIDQPDSTEIVISLERDAGTVTMFDPDGNEHDQFSHEDGFAGVVNAAIEAAIAAAKGEQ